MTKKSTNQLNKKSYGYFNTLNKKEKPTEVGFS